MYGCMGKLGKYAIALKKIPTDIQIYTHLLHGGGGAQVYEIKPTTTKKSAAAAELRRSMLIFTLFYGTVFYHDPRYSILSKYHNFTRPLLAGPLQLQLQIQNK